MTRIAHFVVTAILVLPLPALSDEPPPSAPAQALIEKTLAKHPEAAHIVLHVTPPGAPETDNVIIASNIGKIGKKADEDDLRVMHTEKVETVVAKTGDRFNVSQVFKDSSGKTIGVIAIGFPYKAGDDKAALQKQAEKIRAEVEKQVPSAAALFEKL